MALRKIFANMIQFLIKTVSSIIIHSLTWSMHIQKSITLAKS